MVVVCGGAVVWVVVVRGGVVVDVVVVGGAVVVGVGVGESVGETVGGVVRDAVVWDVEVGAPGLSVGSGSCGVPQAPSTRASAASPASRDPHIRGVRRIAPIATPPFSLSSTRLSR